jgi:hypothetical protein
MTPVEARKYLEAMKDEIGGVSEENCGPVEAQSSEDITFSATSPNTVEVYIDPVCFKCRHRIPYFEKFTAVRVKKLQTNFYCNDCKPFSYEGE